MKAWHEDDEFWAAMAPLFFDEGHWTSAPVEAERALALLGVEPGAAILDLCCGPGRHSLELARRGFRVTGVDRMAAYLQEARRRAGEERLTVELTLDDMRRFTRPGAFDAAVNLSTSFGYFESPDEDGRVLLNLHRSLKAARDFRPTERHDLGDGTVILEERRISKDGTRYEKRRRVVADGRVRHEFNVAHRLYSALALSALLEECGFRAVETYGSLAGVPYDENAEHLVAVARK